MIMRMNAHLAPCLLLLVCSASVCYANASALTQGEDKEVIRQARASYYSLRRLGLVEFQANVRPNWEAVLKTESEANPSRTQAALRLLNGLHFSMTLDSLDKVQVNHTLGAATPNEQIAQGYRQIIDGMAQVVSGFFDTWNLFMLNSPLPAVDAGYHLHDSGGQYLLTYKEGAVAITTTMTKDFMITGMKVVSSEFTGSVKPRFDKTPDGYVLVGYEGDYRSAGGQAAAQLNVDVDYQIVKGLRLPQKLVVDSTLSGTRAPLMELLFTEYQVKTRR